MADHRYCYSFASGELPSDEFGHQFIRQKIIQSITRTKIKDSQIDIVYLGQSA